MATEHIREKINTLNNLILTESLQSFQHELLVEAATKSTGDPQVDATVMKPNAENAKAVLLASARRLEVYRARLAALQAELASGSKPGG